MLQQSEGTILASLPVSSCLRHGFSLGGVLWSCWLTALVFWYHLVPDQCIEMVDSQLLTNSSFELFNIEVESNNGVLKSCWWFKYGHGQYGFPWPLICLQWKFLPYRKWRNFSITNFMMRVFSWLLQNSVLCYCLPVKVNCCAGVRLYQSLCWKYLFRELEAVLGHNILGQVLLWFPIL